MMEHSMLTKTAAETRLGQAASASEARVRIQNGLDKLQKWSGKTKKERKSSGTVGAQC